MQQYYRKKGRNLGRFARIPFSILNSDAFNVLKPSAVSVYLNMFRQFNGYNNGYIIYSCRQAATWANVSANTASRSLKQLQEVGLIKCTVKSTFNNRKKLASEWAFTHEPTVGSKTPSSEWRNFTANPSVKNKGFGINRNTHVFDLKDHITR
ncbi:MAG: hypothetical protein CMM90_02585 [Rickettsiales bacterium]|nr:hypothetical protein [Rickettsiales bacterium]|tara:strand:+ start:337 stop:792 length:456 start_codon:yes stop_codon:yes gene_type:complete